MLISEYDAGCIRQAIQLALEAEGAGNLPIGAVISLDEAIIAEGKNAMWSPEFRPHRHAEIEALCSVPAELWERSREMTLYTTLEPCLMCMAAILLHGIDRVVYGSADDYGGGGAVAGHLPRFFEERLSQTEWIGPAFPEECDPLFKRMTAIEGLRDLPTREPEPPA
jgi:tRNA(adenine34) deaminase